MNLRLTAFLAVAFGLVTFAAAKSHNPAGMPAAAPTSITSEIPIPLCPPDTPDCDPGGQIPPPGGYTR